MRLSKTFLILRIIERCLTKNIVVLRIKCPLLLSDFNETWIFSTDFRKTRQIWNFMKIRPEGAELFQADGRTDITKRIVAFRSIANVPVTFTTYSHVVRDTKKAMWPRTKVLTTVSSVAFSTTGCVSCSVSISSPLRTENVVSRDDGRRPSFRNFMFFLQCILCCLTEVTRSVPVRGKTAVYSETNTEPSNSVFWGGVGEGGGELRVLRISAKIAV
jgi:hypothetical protein